MAPDERVPFLGPYFDKDRFMGSSGEMCVFWTIILICIDTCIKFKNTAVYTHPITAYYRYSCIDLKRIKGWKFAGQRPTYYPYTTCEFGVIIFSLLSLICLFVCSAPTSDCPGLERSFLVCRYTWVYLGQARVSSSSGQGQGHGSKERACVSCLRMVCLWLTGKK